MGFGPAVVSVELVIACVTVGGCHNCKKKKNYFYIH
jgi:hypothetical protein